MKREPLSYLWDMYQSCVLIQKFTREKNFEEYDKDVLLQKGVERCFEIIGEALNPLSKLDSSLASQIPGSKKIVDFQNILVHNYEAIENLRIWDYAQNSLPTLKSTLVRIIKERDPNFSAEEP